MGRPRIAVLLDENTSGGGTRYEAAKGYFRGVADAGGLPFGIPYLACLVDVVLGEYDGLVPVGGRFAYPEEWYLPGEVSQAPPSERFAIERALVEGFLARDKPVLGICAGMQMLACLHGCRLTADLRRLLPRGVEHDGRDRFHSITLVPGSRLESLVGLPRLAVNSFHREAVAELRRGWSRAPTRRTDRRGRRDPGTSLRNRDPMAPGAPGRHRPSRERAVPRVRGRGSRGVTPVSGFGTGNDLSRTPPTDAPRRRPAEIVSCSARAPLTSSEGASMVPLRLEPTAGHLPCASRPS
jgi:putative glutamine amidotransferase